MSLNSQKAELSHPYPSGFMSRHILWVLLAILLLVSRAAAQTASPSTLPPEGSDESKIAIGDVPAKVVALLGEPLSYSDISPTRSRCVFKRCTIVFESRKVAGRIRGQAVTLRALILNPQIKHGFGISQV